VGNWNAGTGTDSDAEVLESRQRPGNLCLSLNPHAILARRYLDLIFADGFESGDTSA